MAVSLDQAVIQIIVSTIILGPVLWLAGRALVGKQKAKFTDGLWIAALGTIIGMILGFFFVPGVLITIIMIIVWLALIKRFFDCGWLKALLVAIVAIVIFIVIAFILALIGFAALTSFLPSYTP
jgi:hypothetical protein